ncbi:40S ribosomal protein S17 [Tanacetum coccineum]
MGRVRTKTVKKSSRVVIESASKRDPVRGISLKLQEEETDRCMDFVPDESAIRTDVIEVDKETIDMLVALGMGDLPGVVKVPEAVIGLTTEAVCKFAYNITKLYGY